MRTRWHWAQVWPIAVIVAGFACATPQDVEPPRLTELVPGFDYGGWFNDLTGFPPDPDGFGAYAIQPIGATLYLGFGANRPAWSDGAAIAAVDGDGFRSVTSLDEQGLLDLAAVGNTLLVPGVDPCCGDTWDFGNFYTIDPTAGVTKWRNLPNVIHGWGTWVDSWDRAIYVAVSSHLGDFQTWTGEIWRTVDTGAHWERVAARDEGVGEFRTYDVIGQHDRLYAVKGDTVPECMLMAQPALGTIWANVLGDARITCSPRLVNFGDRLVAMDSSRAALHVILPRKEPTVLTLPFWVAEWTLNWGTVAGQHFYVAAEDGTIWLTRDLLTWEAVATAPGELLAIQHWPVPDRLVVTSRGADASVWTLQLCETGPC